MQSTKLIKENNNKPKHKLPRVNTVDVEYIGKILKLKFITNNIDFNTLDTYINGVDSTISIMELDRILS